MSILLVLSSYLAGANWAIVSACSQEERCAHFPTVSSCDDDLACNSGTDVVAHFLADRCLQEAAMAEVNQSHRTYVSLTSRTVSTSAHFMQPFHTDAVDFTFKIGQSAAAMVNVLLADQSRPTALPVAAAKISTAIYSSGRSIVDWTHVTQSRGRPYDVASICQPWLSLNPIGRDRHSSSSSYTHGDQMQKMRGGSASGLGDTTSPLATCQNKRWSVAGAAPELTLLRVKLDDVQRELCDLQSKHEVMTMEYQNVLNELECCRESKARLDTEVNEAKMEAMQWKNDYEMMIQQKQQPSERQVIDLQVKLQSRQTELEELRRQYRELLDGRPARRDLNSTLMDEYNDLCMEANRLKERCCILEGETMELRGALRLAQEEFRHLHLSHEEDMEAQRCKVSSLEDRQVTLYQQLHKLAQDRDILRSENEMLKQQMQDLCSDVTRNLNIRQKLEEDMHLLRRQHDGVLAEYHHVMSERDSVLKENERLSEAKSSLMKKLKTSDSDRQALIEQLKTIEVQLESLRRERDELQHQVNVHEEELTEAATSTQAQFLSTDGDSESHSTLYPETKSISSIEGELNGNGSTKIRVNDELRRLNDSLKEELTSVRQEVEGAKQQRDWALAERQRIVSEREGIRHMSETLRLERDEAVTNLAIAIRDADTLRCQKEHAERELRKLKDMLEKGDRRLTNVESTPSNSHDSAIDTDMAEWEVENLEFNMSGCQKNEELGIVLRGGRDDPIFNQIVPIYVKSIVAGSKLDGVLRVYDCIMQVNNIDVSLMERRSVMDILRNSNAVKMVIRRRRLVGMKLISVPINTASDGGVGIVFEDGVYVSKIKTSSAAAKAGNLAVGDRLVYVNDIPVQNRSAENVDELIQSFKDCGLVLAVMKSPPVLSPITPTGGGSYNSCHAVVAASKDRHFDSFSLGHPSPKVVPKRDVSVQASISADSTVPVAKKHESLLDKVHDKLFGRSERKATIRASAAIPMEPVAAAATDSISESGKRWRPNQAASSQRRARPSSVYGNYTVVDRSKGAITEQQVLQQLDSILEASEKEFDDRTLANVANVDRSSAGGTWPKYKPTATGSGACIQPEVADSSCGFEPLQPGVTTTFSGRLNPFSVLQSADKYRRRGNIVAPTEGKTRSGETRPTSYHPSSVFSSRGAVISENSPVFSSRPTSPFIWPEQQQQQQKQQQQQQQRSLAACDGPSSSHGTMEHKTEPSSFSNLVNQPASIVMFKQTHQLQMARAMPVVATSQRYFPLSNYGCAGRNGQTSIEQELDQRSVNSQSSGSRTALGDQSPTKSLNLVERMSNGAHCFSQAKRASNKESRSRPLMSFSSDEYRLSNGDIRTLYIEKRSSHEGLGISIASSGNGVFVSSVSENSLAARHGLQVGDQLLEVCGINMRSANIQHASNVLSHLGRSEQITLMVQYNPGKYAREMSDYRSACSTPRATPYSMLAAQKAFMSQDSSLQSGSAGHSHEMLTVSHCSVHYEPRFVFLKRSSDDWGFTLIGGNAVGIFVDDVKPSLVGGADGLHTCDQVLEFDGVDFRKLTLEQAMYEAGQRLPGSEVSVLVQYNETKYQKCKRGASDSLYIRATVDRQAENTDELSFKAGDILRVDNTVFNGVFGHWRAWLIDQEGRERSCGIIPSKSRLEEEFMFKRSGSEISTLEGSSDGGGSRRGTIRRSLKFIRRSSRSGHQRTPSKESRDMENDSAVIDELYQRVEQCVKPMPLSALEQGLKQNVYVDYRKRDKLFEATRVAAVKDLIDKGYHCILHVSPTSVERLHRLQIYPVVIFVKLKSPKQIKELCDDRLTTKQAKEMFESACKLEAEYHHLFSAVITGPHHSVKHICQQIACTVEHEQKKTLWILSGETM
ncbi:disks large 5 [Trichuris trichiura]|uniref:Disks large 5 n=1 Tax=Trichuris trichiura TaxID=36087 RepID=A0A077Z523_TRITR|nr:disks large 5 [Trichuris trichiura]